MLETARSSTFLFLTGPFGVWRTHASGLPVQTEVYKTFMQIRLLLFLLCIFLMTPIDGYVKAGNGKIPCTTPGEHSVRIRASGAITIRCC